MAKWLYFLCLCLFGALPVTAAEPVVVADIPFEFEVSGQRMPAARYVLQPVGAGMLVRLDDGAGHQVLAVMTRMGDRSGRPELTFAKRGGRVVLTGVAYRGSETFVNLGPR